MTHLKHREFADLVDGRLAPARAEHAETCPTCRAQADLVRAAIAEAASDPPPDPSPLFWDHFATRVADAVRAEPAPRPENPLWAWFSHPVPRWTAASLIGMLTIAAVAWRVTLHAPEPSSVNAPAAAIVAGAGAEPAPAVDDDPDGPDGDAAWAVVRTAAAGMKWEDANAAGLEAHPASVERAVLDLTPDERAELARLLESEMKRATE
jgi:hypothetical protein